MHTQALLMPQWKSLHGLYWNFTPSAETDLNENKYRKTEKACNKFQFEYVYIGESTSSNGLRSIKVPFSKIALQFPSWVIVTAVIFVVKYKLVKNNAAQFNFILNN